MRTDIPEPAPVEDEILRFFSDRNFERSRRFAPGAYDPSVLRDYLATVQNPQHRYRTIHIAGTVGKGSVTNHLSGALTALGLRTGAYLSPHFVSLKERVLVNGEPISDQQLADVWAKLKRTTELSRLSFFDAMTALAFETFADTSCQWAVIETGLGGRSDSTNNLRSEFSVITKIDLDHQKILGSTLSEIAHEKAGIIRPGQRVYTALQHTEAMQVLHKTCDELGSSLIEISPKGYDFVERNRNFAEEIMSREFAPNSDQASLIRAALLQPVFGRFTVLREKPRIVFDSGHNAAAMRALAEIVNRQPESRCNFFLNTMLERDLKEFCTILRTGIRQDVRLFLFPMANENYYQELMQKPDDTEIERLLGEDDTLHIFAGSMSLYRELRLRFSL